MPYHCYVITRPAGMRSSRSKFNILIVAQPLACRTIEDMHWIRIKWTSNHPYSSYTAKSSSSSLLACCSSVNIVPEPVNPFCNPIVLPAGRGSKNERAVARRESISETDTHSTRTDQEDCILQALLITWGLLLTKLRWGLILRPIWGHKFTTYFMKQA